MFAAGKKCLYCKASLDDKKSHAKFCSNSCRAKHFKENRFPKVPTETPETKINPRGLTLAGLIESKTTPSEVLQIPESLQRLSAQITLYKSQLQTCNATLQEFQAKKAELTQQLNRLKWKDASNYFMGASVGGVTGGMFKMPYGGWIGAGIGAVIAGIINNSEKEKNKAKLLELEGCIQQVTLLEIAQSQEIAKGEEYLKPLLAQHWAGLVSWFQSRLMQRETSQAKTLIERTEQEDLQAEGDRIISSIDLAKMSFKALKFQGRWLVFFGQPSLNFYCIIHGLPGGGKSTFALLFAKYLAETFGPTIYISGEEGISLTLQDKILRNKSNVPNLHCSDVKTVDEILEHVPQDAYSFIFIDSLDAMKIDLVQLKKLRAHYKNSAFITISQSTKSGQIRGSQELPHESDIEVKVVQGKAYTVKNRFQVTNLEFDIHGKTHTDKPNSTLNDHNKFNFFT